MWVWVHRSQPSSIMIHIRMLDSTAQLQQEALGVLGVNFIHAALTMGDDVSSIISSLFSDLSRSRLEVAPCACVHVCVCVHTCIHKSIGHSACGCLACTWLAFQACRHGIGSRG